jgi:hypothetical protein
MTFLPFLLCLSCTNDSASSYYFLENVAGGSKVLLLVSLLITFRDDNYSINKELLVIVIKLFFLTLFLLKMKMKMKIFTRYKPIKIQDKLKKIYKI